MIDHERINTLLESVERMQVAVSKLHAQGDSLEIAQAVLCKLMQAVDTLMAARDLAVSDEQTWIALEVSRRHAVAMIQEVTYKCIALENQQAIVEARAATIH